MLFTLWEDFLKSVAAKKKENPVIHSILNQLQPTELTDNKIVLSCDNDGVRFFIQKRIPEIERHLFQFLNKKVAIEIVVVAKKRKVSAPLLQFEPSPEDIFKKSGINIKYSFENFAVSSTNQVAYAAAQAVSHKLAKAYNPLFLYGGVGVGKTHLAQAVGRSLLERSSSKKVVFCPGDQFTNELIEAIRDKTTPKFRRKYRHLDLLIVDDIQFIAGKNTMQEEFFHTFNAIVSSGGQIILTSDRSPDQIKKLEDRLRSRFSGGLIVDIQPPGFELRTAIIMLKARDKNIEIGIESAQAIADQITDSRGLEGAILSLYAKTLNNGEVINLDTVEEFFKLKNSHQNSEGELKKITADQIFKAVCAFYNLRPTHLKSPSRAESVALPRQVAMFLLRQGLKLKLEEIAFLLKRKDHTTILHGVEKINRLMIKNEDFRKEVDRIRSLLGLSTMSPQ